MQPDLYALNPGKLLKNCFGSFQRVSNGVAGVDMVKYLNNILMFPLHRYFIGAVGKGNEFLV